MSKIDELMQQGLHLHQTGRFAEAEAIYGKVLRKQPSHPAANHLSGVLLLQRGDATGAVHLLQKAVHLHGENAEYLGNLGTALNAAGRPAEALSAFERSLKVQPRAPRVLNNQAMALKALGRLDDALTTYRAAIALSPQEPGFYRNFANALAELGDLHGAEENYRRALALRPNFPNALTGLVNSLATLGRLPEAVTTAATAAARFPHEPEIHRAHAHALWLSGDPAAAAAAYRAAIAANSLDVEAHRLLGQVVPRTAIDAEVEAVQQLLDRPGLAPDAQAQLHFTLAQAFDDSGDGARAAVHFRSANALVRQSRPFDLTGALADLSALEDAFARLPDSAVPPLQPASGPVFIVGLPRSGKSTLEGQLGRHPALHAAGELSALANMAGALVKNGEDVATILADPDRVSALGQRFLAMAERLAPGRRLLDTMPNNFRLVGAIRLAMPTARIIHCVRDPRLHAIALHQKYYALSGNGYTSDLAALVAFQAGYRRQMSFWHRRFSGFIWDVDMSAAPDFVALCRHLGLPAEAACALPYVSEPRLPTAETPRRAALAALLADLDGLSASPGSAR